MNPSLSEILERRLQSLGRRTLAAGECQTPSRKVCSLCHASRVSYEDELTAKRQAIDEWWRSLEPDVPCHQLVPSPRGRFYRTVSKRKAFLSGRTFNLGLIGVDEDTARNFPFAVDSCVIEPPAHAAVYRTVQNYLQRKESAGLAGDFNYVIVKGSEAELVVILNVNDASTEYRREINRLSKHLTGAVPEVKGVFAFVDTERSRYYLSDTSRTALQKIYGIDTLFHRADGLKFGYSPLSFSQTNHSILTEFIASARSLLDLRENDDLLDLYSGYGLFTLSLSRTIRRAAGMEISSSSIADAQENARRNRIHNAAFIRADVTAVSLERFFTTRRRKGTDTPLKALLDPPRGGTADGVIECIAAQRPSAVVHIFCNASIVRKELLRWRTAGYRPVHAIPFDMFPGTAEIELMVHLKPQSP